MMCIGLEENRLTFDSCPFLWIINLPPLGCGLNHSFTFSFEICFIMPCGKVGIFLQSLYSVPAIHTRQLFHFTTHAYIMLKSQNKMIVLQLTQILQEKSFVNTDGDLNP